MEVVDDSPGYTPSVDDAENCSKGIESLYVLPPAEQRTLRNLVYGLPPHLGPALRPLDCRWPVWIVFDNPEDTLTFSHFQTFDFQGMDEIHPQVLETLLFYIFQRISQVVYDPELLSVSKQLWGSGVAVSRERHRPPISGCGRKDLAEAQRRHRPDYAVRRGSANAGVLDLVNEICPTKILLASPGADLMAYQRMFRLNEREAEIFSALIPKRQFLLKTALRSKVLNVNVDPHAHREYTNSPFDNQRRLQAIEQFGVDEGLKVLAAQVR
jgi:type IV secretion system protein VirB4